MTFGSEQKAVEKGKLWDVKEKWYGALYDGALYILLFTSVLSSALQ